MRHRLVTTAIEDQVAVLRVCRRQAGQSLNPATLFQLRCAFEAALADDSVRGIVLTGEAGRFASGADVRYFAARVAEADYEALLTFTRDGNELFDAISGSPKRVVAAINGSALGGGLELALACCYRVATPAASLSFPETALGLVPGWGGGARAAELLGVGLAKWLVYLGPIVSAKAALALGLIDRVVSPVDLLKVAKGASLQAPLRAVASVPPDIQAIAACLHATPLHGLLTGGVGDLSSDEISEARRQLATRSGSALREAERQFDLAAQLNGERFAAANLELVERVFRSHDAHAGLRAFAGERRAPGGVAPRPRAAS